MVKATDFDSVIREFESHRPRQPFRKKLIPMSVSDTIVQALTLKSEKYPWMETFFVTDEEILQTTQSTVSRRALNRKLKSLKPVFRLDETQRYDGRKVRKYAFNSWELGKMTDIERHGDNTAFIKNAMAKILK